MPVRNCLTVVLCAWVLGRPCAAEAGEYWLQIHQTLHLNEAASVAATVHPTWAEGGRIAQVIVRRNENCTASGSMCYRVHVGSTPTWYGP